MRFRLAIWVVALAACDRVFGGPGHFDASLVDTPPDLPLGAGGELPECRALDRTAPVIPTEGAKDTFYVDGTQGNDTNPCTLVQPCKTIQKGLDTASAKWIAGLADVVVNVHGGSEYVADNAAAAVTIRAQHDGVVLRDWEGTGRPMISGGGLAAAGIWITTGSAPLGVTVSGFDVSGAKTHGVVIEGSGAVGNTIANMVIRDNGATGDAEAAGIALRLATRDNVIAYNEVFRNVGAGSSKPSGIRANQATGPQRFIGNFVHGNGNTGMTLKGEQAIVAGNRVTDNRGDGIEAFGDGTTLCHNVTWRNDNAGVRVSGSIVRVVHQTTTDNGMAGVYVSGKNTVLKNVITAFNAGCGIERANDPLVTDPVDHHNLYFMNVTDRCEVVPDAPALDVMADPMFEERNAGDFALRRGSPAIGAGEDGSTMGALP